ncbi:MAG: TIGR01212 family radical SAM protein [Spirochaetes bacterium]|nr:TIGR01212 family radical SAM protein [Spirochaetota bacterium]
MVRTERYNSYSRYLQGKYGGKTYRIGVDAGFSCPNRGPNRSERGCSFCDVNGSRSPYLGSLSDVGEQIRKGLGFLRTRYGATRFILYFQAYTNTYAKAEQLRTLYSYGLSLGEFKELIVSTRPDCIDPQIVDVLASFKTKVEDVWVELGLQSSNESTLQRIQRGHGRDAFEKAFFLLRSHHIKVAVHLIFGLPGEGWEEILQTIRYVAAFRPDGIKIHNLHIPYQAPLFQEFLLGELSLPCAERHLEYVVKALELLPPETLIMRLTCDTPKERLAFPRAFPDKASFLTRLARRLEEQDTWQGRRFTG